MSDIVSETDLWLHTRECWQAECSYNTLHITGSNPVLTTILLVLYLMVTAVSIVKKIQQSLQILFNKPA